MGVEQRKKNHGGYKGEQIDIQVVLEDDLAAARQHGWQVDRLSTAPGPGLLAFRRELAGAQRNIYLSTGIHGDEPAGPLAIRQLLQANRWPDDTALWVCPCLNPAGFPLNRRDTEPGIDPNRDYRHLRTPGTRAHVAWLERQPRFDLALCLHEDWESAGFYLYELNPEHRPTLAEPMIRAVQAICPVDPSSVIEGREARGGIIRPDLDPAKRPEWPESFYLIQNKTRLSYTLEAPSELPLATRVAVLTVAVEAALETAQAQARLIATNPPGPGLQSHGNAAH
jgi:murein peptide amidase A